MNFKPAKIMMDSSPNENFIKLHNMAVQEFDKGKVPFVQIDPSLEKYRDNTPFPGKLEKANKMLETVKLPKRKNRG